MRTAAMTTSPTISPILKSHFLGRQDGRGVLVAGRRLLICHPSGVLKQHTQLQTPSAAAGVHLRRRRD
jgi:hypothetical protein